MIFDFDGWVKYWIHPGYADIALTFNTSIVEGTILNLYTEKHKGKSDNINYVSYSFIASDGQQYTAEKTIPDNIYSQLCDQTKISIKYVSFDPYVSVPSATRDDPFEVILYLVLGLFNWFVIAIWFVFAILFPVAIFLKIRNYLRLTNDGKLITGEIVEVNDSNDAQRKVKESHISLVYVILIRMVNLPNMRQ